MLLIGLVQIIAKNVRVQVNIDFKIPIAIKINILLYG